MPTRAMAGTEKHRHALLPQSTLPTVCHGAAWPRSPALGVTPLGHSEVSILPARVSQGAGCPGERQMQKGGMWIRDNDSCVLQTLWDSELYDLGNAGNLPMPRFLILYNRDHENPYLQGCGKDWLSQRLGTCLPPSQLLCCNPGSCLHLGFGL